jgi:hypothetical protein
MTDMNKRGDQVITIGEQQYVVTPKNTVIPRLEAITGKTILELLQSVSKLSTLTISHVIHQTLDVNGYKLKLADVQDAVVNDLATTDQPLIYAAVAIVQSYLPQDEAKPGKPVAL